MTGRYKPVWMFWHHGSGLLGGMIFGCVVGVLIVIALAHFA